MFPADALARELLADERRVALVTDGRGGGYGETLATVEVHRVRAGQVAGRGPIARAGGLAALALGTLEARALLARLAPAAAVGFGGYASVPTMLAASWARIPTVIHEQNAVLGRANRLLAGRMSRIATSFAEVAGLGDRARGKASLTGNPVRSEITAIGRDPYPRFAEDGPLRILVLGGSQGARVFSHIVPAAVALLPEGMRARLRLDQQCRAEDLEAARTAYRASGTQAELAAFFDDVPRRLARAHLAICRAGASTVAELCAAGRPAVLVPYPHAADDHQTANARAMAEAGGGWLAPEPEFTAESLAARLETVFERPASLGQAAAGARAMGLPEAARRLAEVVHAVTPAKGGSAGAPGAGRLAA